MATLDPGVIESVINTNFKAGAEQATQNMLAHQNRLNIMAEKALGSTLISMDQNNVSQTEAAAEKAIADSGLAANVAALGAAVAAIQQALKGAQTTPPVTAP